jgi:hypothetical protein
MAQQAVRELSIDELSSVSAGADIEYPGRIYFVVLPFEPHVLIYISPNHTHPTTIFPVGHFGERKLAVTFEGGVGY